jgi:predicted nucleic acid-binding protein
MRLVVQDANIIIDLIDCEIFELFFRLELEVVTTSLVLGEISDASQKKQCQAVIRKKLLHLVEISTLEYLRLQALDLPGLSVTDRSVLDVAKARQASLLTGDGKLRKTAKTSDIDVRGILWVFDQLVKSGLRPKAEAHGKLSDLQERNQRLPKVEIKKRLRSWGG